MTSYIASDKLHAQVAGVYHNKGLTPYEGFLKIKGSSYALEIRGVKYRFNGRYLKLLMHRLEDQVQQEPQPKVVTKKKRGRPRKKVVEEEVPF